MPDLITLHGITKLRENRAVLRHVDLAVGNGELHLVLGDNGAGKSTLLRIMAGLLRPTSGQLERQENVGLAYLGHATFLYDDLTALENLRFQARIQQIKVTDAELLTLLEQAELRPHAYTKTRHFSRGMAQRLNFCRVLLLQPRLLLLDEPFTGMDVSSRLKVRQQLKTLRDNGVGVVLVSHDPDSDGQLASHCHVLVSGHLTHRELPC